MGSSQGAGSRDWAYALAKNSVAWKSDGGPWLKLPGSIVIKDAIADAFLQQIPAPGGVRRVYLPLTATFISDALLRPMGRRDRPGAGVSTSTPSSKRPVARPKYAGSTGGESGSLILSAEMMLPHGLEELPI